MSIDTQTDGASATPPEAKTESLVSATVGDRCVNCGSSLASDQRYCVVCGERRGAARFSLPAAAPAAAAASAPAPRRDRRRNPFGSGATLVAGVGTLLLALGVGVLIGHDTGKSSKPVTAAAAPIKVITVGGTAAPVASTPAAASSSTGAGSSGSASSTGGKSSAKSGGKSSAKAGGKSAAKSSAPSAAAKAAAAKKAAAAAAAAAKVPGGPSATQPPPTVTVGQAAPKGEAGVNKKTGKFDGSFFH